LFPKVPEFNRLLLPVMYARPRNKLLPNYQFRGDANFQGLKRKKAAWAPFN